MTIKTFTVNPLGVNCYVLSDETGEGAIVDCGAFNGKEFRPIEEYVRHKGIQLKHHLLTHAHFDHMFSADSVFSAFGLAPELHPLEREVWAGMPAFVRQFCGIEFPLPAVQPNYTLHDGAEIHFGQTTLRVLHTPGHTPGGVCLYAEAEATLLSGDTLFQYSVGRTDLPLGSSSQLMQSLRNVLAPLPADVKVYPGHGAPTTIGQETDLNPYLN